MLINTILLLLLVIVIAMSFWIHVFNKRFEAHQKAIIDLKKQNNSQQSSPYISHRDIIQDKIIEGTLELISNEGKSVDLGARFFTKKVTYGRQRNKNKKSFCCNFVIT